MIAGDLGLMKTRVAEVILQQRIIKKGYGYWDVTNYSYGGCFKRATSDTPITVIGPGHREDQFKIEFQDGRIAHAPKQGIMNATEQR